MNSQQKISRLKAQDSRLISPHSALSTQPSALGFRRGSVIVLVVAVLALLAVIGTIYVISARSERAGASAASSALNMDFAQKSINNQAIEAINNSMYDAQGILGGYAAYGPYGDHTARRWDIPEGYPAAMQLTTSSPPLPLNPNAEFNNPRARNEAWLADGIYRYNSAQLSPYPNLSGFYNGVSILTPGVYDPTDGLYDIPIFNGASVPVPNFNSTQMFQTVADNIYLKVGPVINGTAIAADADSYINLLPFSDASGIRYRYGLRIVDTSSMANLNVGLPYNFTGTPAAPGQAAFGTFITDYNLGSPAILNSADENAGAFNNLMAYRGGVPASDSAWSYAVLHSDAVINQPALSLFDTGDELELRAYGGFGTGLVPRPAGAWPNTLSASAGAQEPNFNRNFYTAYSYARDLMPFPWLDPGLYPVASTKPYTLTGMFAPASWAGSTVWPPFPSRVSANPNLFAGATTGGAAIAADRMAEAATNIATAMEILPQTVLPSGTPGYSAQESRAFAANYITYHNTSGWTADSNGKLTLLYGPSLVDAGGICVRGVGTAAGYAGAQVSRDYGGAGSGDLSVASEKNPAPPTPSTVYLGYAAQPFITQVVITIQPPTIAPASPAAVADTAIELYNPYSVALSLNGYTLTNGSLANGATPSLDCPLDGNYIPAGGFFIVATSGLQAKITTGATVQVYSGGKFTKLALTDTDVYLMRTYYPRQLTGGNAIPKTPASAAVDHYLVTPLMKSDPGTGMTAVPFYVARSNPDASHTNQFVVAVETPTSENPQSGVGTLGIATYITDSVADKAPVLWDYVGMGLPGGEIECLNNIADFNRVMRICDEIDGSNDATGGLPTGGTIPQQLNTLITTANAATPVNPLAIEGDIHFDFAAVPWLYSYDTPGAGSSAANPLVLPALPPIYPTLETRGAPAPGDLRAVNLLECLSFVDRESDNTIQMGDENYAAPLAKPPFNGSSLSKLRIPGRINVNTAPAEVLATIPALVNNANASVYIRAILAYRWRSNTNDPRIPPTFPASATVLDFTSQANYPGYGIHSMAELNIPLIVAQEQLGAWGAPGTPPPTLDARDQLWASIYNYLTVRSDTFAVYGYLEAVKPNPRYTGAFVNGVPGTATTSGGADWYDTNYPNNIIDDPNAPNAAAAPLLRVARKRWIAIVDRSQCNYNIGDSRNTKPRIIAIRDLPQ